MRRLTSAWANFPLRIKGLVVVAIPLVAVLLAGVSLYLVQEQEQRAQAAARHTFQVRNQITTVRTLLLEAETGVHGYLLSGERASLRPYENAFVALPDALARLERLVGDYPSQLDRVRRTAFLTGKKLELLAALRRAGAAPGGNLPAIDERRLAESESTMNALREQIATMQSVEERRLQERVDAVQMAIKRNLLTFLGGTLFGLAGGVVAALLFTTGVARRIHRLEDNARRLAEELPMLDRPPGNDEIGSLSRSLGAAGDLLADRKRKLLEAQAFLEELIASSPVVILSTLFDDKITYASPNVERLLGYSPQEIVAVEGFWLDHIHPDERAGFASEIERARKHRDHEVELEYRFLHKDGSYRWLYTVMRLEYDESGEVSNGLGYALDVTARKAAQEALAQREATLAAIFETSPDVIAVLTPEGNRSYVSPAVRQMLGYAPEDLVGKQSFGQAHPEDQSLVNQLLDQARSLEGPVRSRFRLQHADGHWVWIDCWACRMTGESSALADSLLVIGRDVNMQVQLEEALKRAKDQAERASLAKSAFLSRTSHELRTPLNAILGFAQLMGMHDLRPQESESVSQIVRAGRHLLELMNDVLDIARVESGELAVSSRTIEVDGAVEEALQLVRPMAAQQGVNLEEALPVSSNEYVLADQQRLKQVLLNLLSNAIKYNRPGGSVTVSFAVSDPVLRIMVRDTGPGISAEKIERLFTPFDRLGAEQTDVEGTGLGLALSKRLAQAMGGDIGVTSEVGRGSTFWIELPLVRAPLKVADLETDDAGVGTNGLREARTVVYIEDNLANLKLVEGILAYRPSVRLLPAMQGRLGLDLAREHTPDLILLDLHLPDMPGEEVLRRLREDVRTKDAHILVLSADATSDRIKKLLESGADGYLTKPLDIATFLKAVDNSLSVKR